MIVPGTYVASAEPLGSYVYAAAHPFAVEKEWRFVHGLVVAIVVGGSNGSVRADFALVINPNTMRTGWVYFVDLVRLW